MFGLPDSLRAVNVLVRCLTLVSRSALLVVLARFMSPEALGLYGLIAASVSFALMSIGLDFYTFTTRELIATNRSTWGGRLKSHLSLMLVMYGLGLPIAAVALDGALPWSLAGCFVAVLVLEHLAQEIHRVLIASEAQLTASFVLFLRSGVWVWVVAWLMAIDASAREVSVVLVAWACSAAMSCALGVWRMSKAGIGGWRAPVDWSWVLRGVRTAVPLLLGTLALKGIQTADRYAIDSLAGGEVLGAYVLYCGIAGALLSFLDAGVFSYAYPTLIAAARRGDMAGFRNGMKGLSQSTFVLSLLYSLTALVLVGHAVDALGHPAYRAHLEIFHLALASTVVFCLGMVPHYGLYALGHDRSIAGSHIAGLLCFLMALWPLSAVTKTLAVPVAVCLGMCAIALLKAVSYLRLVSSVRLHGSLLLEKGGTNV